MQLLLERDEALATLTAACEAAARGQGRVVFVTGEPGIGKTSLVARFAAGLGAGARILVGTCDDLSIPRPLGALRDLVGGVSAPLEQAIRTGAPPHDVQALLLAELQRAPRPTVLVLEDVHWADEATLDSITVLGRRIGALPALLVLTFRAGEVGPGHPLQAAVGDIRADQSTVLELAPLSASAVASLAGIDSDHVFAATGGNPFYVTELLAARTGSDPPPSVANAVLGRTARLDPAARRLVELVSVVPGRVPTGLLDALAPDWPAAAEEPERRRLLELDARSVRFRHELARHAVRSSLPAAARRRLHGEVLQALLDASADPADIVHHAEAAGAVDVVADHALVAARRAAALDSNREAYSHYGRAVDFVDRLPPPERAAVLEEMAGAAYRVARLEDAFAAIARAIDAYQAVGDTEALGRCLRLLSRLHWYAGDGGRARATALEAIAILQPLGPSLELARAQSGVSQLAMLAEDAEPALAWGERALALAQALGDEPTRAHALVNLGTARVLTDPHDSEGLLEAFAVADAAGDRHEATRSVVNLGYSLICWVRPEPAELHLRRALAYAREHEVDSLASYTATAIALLRLRTGAWDEAEQAARREVGRGTSVPQLLVKTVLAELAIRRGDPDAAERLTEVTAQAEGTRELQRIVPALELATQWALTSGGALPLERFEQLLLELQLRGTVTVTGVVRVSAWARVAGIEVRAEPPPSVPYAAMQRGDWRAAADAFGAVGWPWERALMLSLLDDEGALGDALELARGLGADPLARRAARRLRELGLHVPSGPRGTTRTNLAGLTARQLEVLALLVEGLTNAEIARRLVVSQRTAEHHVAAVLAKLGATTRREAARRASELALLTRT